MSETSNPPAPPAANGNGRRLAKLNSPFFIWPAAAALAALLYFGLTLLNDALTHESTDDAFIAGHVVSIAPRIAGQVLAVYVLDNQMVHSNDLLVGNRPGGLFHDAGAKTGGAKSRKRSSYKAAVAGYELMGVKVKTAEADAPKFAGRCRRRRRDRHAGESGF